MAKKIYSVYDRTPQLGIKFTDESLAIQSAKDECNINHIMARYGRTGLLVDPLTVSNRSPQFGDFSTMTEFIDAQNMIAEAQQLFDMLPASLRKRFSNDPAQMLDFLSSEDNRDEAIKLGLVNAPEPPPRPVEPLLVKMVADPVIPPPKNNA